MTIDHIHALPPGTRFEEYRLDSVLGSGGFGITYRAYDAHLDMFVAIKEYLPAEFAARTEASTVVPKSNTDAQDYHWGLTRFLDEARTLARFNHPNLNRVLRFFEGNGTAYMVLEYVDGETLADRLSRERQLPEQSLRRLLEEVLSGLSVMHDAGYVHRDIKPGNLMLREEDGSAVVLDFGAARQAVGQRSRAITSILTPGYAPVEQYDGKVDRVGAWTDIYALGMVAYRCISGIGDSELPDAVARMLAQSRGEAVLLPAVEAGEGRYDGKLLEAIDWAMEVDEGERPQNVDAWRQGLTGGGRDKGPLKSFGKTAAQPSTGTTGRAGPSWSSIGLTMAIIALLGAGGWWAWQAYPELFGQDSKDTQAVAQQEAPADVSGETQQEAETGEMIAGTEETPLGKAKIEQPVSNESVLSAEEAEQAEVARLLAAAEDDLKARRLTSPAGNNAWEKYLQVLGLSPAHPGAMAGMERVIDSYMQLFSAEVEKEDFDKAAGYLAKIRELHPDSPVLEEGIQLLEDAKQVRTDRLAEQERQRQAEEAARQAELERQRIAQEIKSHWGSFEVALKAEKLDEATRILVKIRGLNPEESGLPDGEQRLSELQQQRAESIQAHWAAFEAAIREENLGEATNILTQVRALNPDEAGLSEEEQRLVQLERRQQEAEAKARQYAGEMVSIPGGTFRMGDLSGDGDDDEKPVHSVTVPAFRMGKYEVTAGQFQRFVEATGYRTDAERNADGKKGCRIIAGSHPFFIWRWFRNRSWRNPGFFIGDNRAVICVSWNDVQAFVKWLSELTGQTFRLPTEAEWEYAVRAGSTSKYSWGNSIGSNRANCKNCGTQWDDYFDVPVGSFSANAWGLHDMHGNVWEWVQDCWSESYVDAPIDGSARTIGSCGQSVVRGGSWDDHPSYLRSASRERFTRSYRAVNIGFRLAQDK